MQGGFDIRNELLSEIEALEKNYNIIKDVRSGVTYDLSDIKGTLQSFKDNLSKVNSLLVAFMFVRGSKPEEIIRLPITPLLNNIDLALSMFAVFPQSNPSDVIQISLGLSDVKIENIMSLVSILKTAV